LWPHMPKWIQQGQRYFGIPLKGDLASHACKNFKMVNFSSVWCKNVGTHPKLAIEPLPNEKW
jgi:hypothetical protein